jgi:hypothetical protein
VFGTKRLAQVTHSLRDRLAHTRRERAGRPLADELHAIALERAVLPVRPTLYKGEDLDMTDVMSIQHGAP